MWVETRNNQIHLNENLEGSSGYHPKNAKAPKY